MREAESCPGNENVFVTQEEVRHLRKEVERLKMERDILKKATVRSTDRCNIAVKFMRGRLKSQGLPRALIKA